MGSSVPEIVNFPFSLSLPPLYTWLPVGTNLVGFSSLGMQRYHQTKLEIIPWFTNSEQEVAERLSDHICLFFCQKCTGLLNPKVLMSTLAVLPVTVYAKPPIFHDFRARGGS